MSHFDQCNGIKKPDHYITGYHIKRRIISMLICLVLFSSLFMFEAVVSEEAPEASFNGDIQAAATLANLDFQDVKGSDSWARPAIYEASALGITVGFPNMAKRFGRTIPLSREEALGVVYRAAGREGEARSAGETINNARVSALKKKDPVQVFYDGCLQLASADGLITPQEFQDAVNADQKALTSENFRRKAQVQRQEMAFWLAKTLNLQPVDNQQDIYNNYFDWRSMDAEKLPFISSILQNRIMNGDGKGRFNPLKAVTREQAAQIIKNAEAYVLGARGYEKLTGTVEKAAGLSDFSNTIAATGKVFDVRNSAGPLHRISTEETQPVKNEQQGKNTPPASKELVVYKNGAIGNSSLIKKGDRIEYIVDTASGVIKYVNALSNTANERYIAARINTIDKINKKINATQLFKLDFPDISLLKKNVSLNPGTTEASFTFKYSKYAAVTFNGAAATVDRLTPDTIVIMTVNSSNLVTGIKAEDFGITSEERYIVRGIVEENNPLLGYISLYNENGTGTSIGTAGYSNGIGLAPLLRSYTYVDQNKLEVYKNRLPAIIDDIEAGDSVFLKLDNDGNVISVSAADNYQLKYGKVLSKLTGKILVEYSDGKTQFLDVSQNVLFIENRRITGFGTLKEGDRVRLLLSITNKATLLKEVTIEGSEHYIVNVYKAEISYIDRTSEKLVMINVQVLNKGLWQRTGIKGFTTIPLADEYSIYSAGRRVSLEKAVQLLQGNDAYVAVEKDYGGAERAVAVSYRSSNDREVDLDDSITDSVSGSDSFSLMNEEQPVFYNVGSIVVRNGRLVRGSSIAEGDAAYIIADRSDETGSLNAGVVIVREDSGAGIPSIYRVRIKSIDENKSFTVESYSKLSGNEWVYYNTPKTFEILPSTRLLADDGTGNIRDFKGYGTGSYLGRAVYIVSMDMEASLVSTVPFGSEMFTGKVYEINGAQIGEEGTLIAEPDNLKLRSTKKYNQQDFIWEDAKEMDIDILKNTVIIKKGEVIKPSDIRNGDELRILKKDTSLAGDAYIIIVER